MWRDQKTTVNSEQKQLSDVERIEKCVWECPAAQHTHETLDRDMIQTQMENKGRFNPIRLPISFSQITSKLNSFFSFRLCIALYFTTCKTIYFTFKSTLKCWQLPSNHIPSYAARGWILLWLWTCPELRFQHWLAAGRNKSRWFVLLLDSNRIFLVPYCILNAVTLWDNGARTYWDSWKMFRNECDIIKKALMEVLPPALSKALQLIVTILAAPTLNVYIIFST